jgi:hypothetical protein
MKIQGTKNKSRLLKKQLLRSKPREVNIYKSEFTDKYRLLIESFNKDSFRLYEELYRKWASGARPKQYLLDECIKQQITGPILELATIRVSNRYDHQKILQSLRHRWTNELEHRREQVNNDENKFWTTMARLIQRRATDDGINLYLEWQGKAGLVKLIDFLKAQFKKQNGICAISKQPMTLKIGEIKKNPDKCSPDRKNSNKGYEPTNLWLVTWWANKMKMDVPMVTFWKRIDILAQVR